MKTIYYLLNKLRPLIMIIVFLIFIAISISTYQQQTSLLMKVIVATIAVVALVVSVFYEYLKYKYTKLQLSLIESTSLEDTKRKRDELERIDMLKGMKGSLILFDVLFSLDNCNPEETLLILNNNEKLFKVNLDYVLIKRFSTFKAYTLLGNRTQSKKAYAELIKLKKTNIKKSNKLHLLYNWDQIEALNLAFNLQDYTKANKLYHSIDSSKMNPREKLHLFYETKYVANKLGIVDAKNEYNKKIREINQNSPFLEK